MLEDGTYAQNAGPGAGGGLGRSGGFGRGFGRGRRADEPVPGARGGRWRRGRFDTPGTLAALSAGDRVIIDSIGDVCARAQALRFGMGEGAAISCVTTLPGGPVVLRSGRQEIAVGRGLARRITVRSADAPGGADV
jgi:Fe2+ transport system protein FeoA